MRETPNFNNLCQWIGLRENFNRKAPKNWWENRWFPLDFPLYPIHWLWPLKSFQMGKSWCLRPWSDPGEDPMRCLAWDPFGPVSLLGEWLESDSDSLLNLLVYWIYWVYSDPNVLLLFFFGSRRWNLTDYGCWIHPTKSIRWTPFPHSFAAPKSKLILFTYEYWATMGIFRIYIVYTLYILCIIIYIYSIMDMRGCQLALAEAHVPAYVSLLSVLSSSCLCLRPPKKGPDPDQKWGRNLIAIQQSEAQLPNWTATIDVVHFCFFSRGCQDAGFTVLVHIYIYICILKYIYIHNIYTHI